MRGEGVGGDFGDILHIVVSCPDRLLHGMESCRIQIYETIKTTYFAFIGFLANYFLSLVKCLYNYDK